MMRLSSATSAELREWWRLCWPTAIAILARNLQPVTDLAFLGRLGTEELGAASVATMLTSVTAAWIWKSLGGAINTLASQAVGAGNPRLAGTWLTISMLASLVCTAVVVMLWWVGSRAVFAAAGLATTTCDLATQYTRWYTLYVFPSHAFVLLTNFLQALGVVMPTLVINVVATGVNAGLNAGCIAAFGFNGSPIATALTAWFSLAATVAYMVTSGAAAGTCQARFWRDGEVCSSRRLRTMAYQAAPTALGNLVEDCQLMVMALLAARLDPASIAAHNSFLNLFFALTCLMYGSVKATTVRIGRHLGAGDVAAAKRVAWIHVTVTAVAGVATGACILGLRWQLGRLFSDDGEVVAAIASDIALPAGSGYALISLFFLAMGVLQGQARPLFVALAFIVGAWAVAVPIAFALERRGLGLLGIWLALVAGYFTTTGIALYGVWRGNWEEAAAAAIRRSRPAVTVDAAAVNGAVGCGGAGGGGGHHDDDGAVAVGLVKGVDGRNGHGSEREPLLAGRSDGGRSPAASIDGGANGRSNGDSSGDGDLSPLHTLRMEGVVQGGPP